MGYLIQFVDSISASPIVRLDLNVGGMSVQDDTAFPPPELRYAKVSTLLGDGAQFPAAAYDARYIKLVVRVDGPNDDAIAAAKQPIYRELNRARNLLRYQPGTSAPVFFRTWRAGPDQVEWNPFTKEITATIPADPFAYGLRETLPAVTVYNNPAEGTTLNANPFFETDTAVQGDFETGITGWVGVNGTAVQSTAQAHSGTGSAFVTPSGTGVVARVEADMSNALPATAGQSFTASAWVRPTNATKPAAVQITWRDAGGAFLSSSVVTAAATAGAWQVLTVTANAPASAAFAQPAAGIGSTPTTADTAHVDELRLSTVTSWTALTGTVTRSTAQSHEGVASLLLTPDGTSTVAEVRSENLPAAPGQAWRGSAWLYCSVARTISMGIIWRTSGGTLISTSLTSISIAAATWTLVTVDGTAPATTATAQLVAGSMSGTPPASNTAWIDEARLRKSGGVGGCCFDATGIKGDVEAPLCLILPASGLMPSSVQGRKMSVIAVRRRGDPSAAPFVLQAESMSMGADTTVQANSAVMSGSGSNWTRTTFATPGMSTRLNVSPWPAVGGRDVRGGYRVFMRYRQSSASGSPMQAQLLWGNSGSAQVFTNDPVTLVQFDGGAGGPYMKYAYMGRVQFPPGYDPVTDGVTGIEIGAEGIFIGVQAARTSGTASLDIDHLLFVPADDGLLLAKWPASVVLPNDIVLESDRGQVYARSAAGLTVAAPGAELDGGPPMVLPGVTNRIYFVRDVGTDSSTTSFGTGDDITATTTITPYYHPRYLHVRPVAS